MTPLCTSKETRRLTWSWLGPKASLCLSSSVQFSHSVVSDSLRPHEPQHARPPCPSPTPRVHPNPCPLSRWCHPTISSTVIPFSSHPQSFPASEFFPMSQFFTSSNEHSGLISFRMDWLDHLAVQGTLHYYPANRFISAIFLDSMYMC